MQHSTWNFIATGENTGEFNMRFDEMLVRRVIDEGSSSTLRIYQWKPWAISLGFHQNIAEIDIARCKNEGIDVVRRPTGGRAILHAEELTYSVVMPAGQMGVHRVYSEISRALVEGLGLFGVDVALQRAEPNFAEMYQSPSSIPCFSSSARYEIVWKGRKLVGSAQRRYMTGSEVVVLQHGSILCGSAHRHLAAYLELEDQQIGKKIFKDLDEKTTDLKQISGSVVNVQELSDCIQRGFERAWGIMFAKKELRTGTKEGAYA